MFQWNFILNSKVSIEKYAFEDNVWKMAAILSRPQCVTQSDLNVLTQMMKRYAHNWHVVVFCCGFHQPIAAIFSGLTSLAYECPSASETIMKNMGMYQMNGNTKTN